MRKIFTEAERDELIVHTERQLDIALVALCEAQAAVEKWRDVYSQNRKLLDTLRAVKIFKEAK